MGNPIRTFHGHAGGNTETPTPRRGFPRRRAIPDAFTSLLVGETFFFVALTGATGRCSEFGAPAYPAEESPRLRVLPVSQSEYPDRTAAQEPSWIRITSTQIQFPTFTLTLSDQTIPVRSQSLVPTISVDALAGRVATTLAFVQDGLSGQPRMTTEPLVFVFADEDAGDSAAPILVASFFRGFLHGPVWLLHPDTGNP
ncbi:MAG: hypothetical protein GYA33_12445, partial [Thermogutta sp.]|nr:hypothetical protein [Thermogutta sp.]